MRDNIFYTSRVKVKGSVSLRCGFLAVAMMFFWLAALAFGQNSADLDSDGVADSIDIDQDNDGIVNGLEGVRRLADLSDSPARHFAVRTVDTVSRSPSFVYDLFDTDRGGVATLTGKVLASDTEIEWSMYDSLARLRNLTAGTTRVQWNVEADQPIGNIDLTISDLDGLRSETVTVDENSIVGYSLSLNSNITVRNSSRQLIFTGTGEGGESIDDLVVLHFREITDILLTYSNSVSTVDDGSLAEVFTDDVDIAGYRHSLQRVNSLMFFTPVTQYRDTDEDGIADHRDLDSDNDGLGDVVESGGIDADRDNLIDGSVGHTGLSVNADPDLDAQAVAAVYNGDNTVSGADSDNDGLLSTIDALPQQFGGSLAGVDSDNDGLDDLDEIRIHQTQPDNPDSDEDGLGDDDEVNQYNTNPLLNDTDSDELSDGEEVFEYGTNPNSDDSDADGIVDGVEVDNGTDPLVSDNAVIVLPEPATLQPEQDIPDLVEEASLESNPEPVNEVVNTPVPESGPLLADDTGSGNVAALRTGRSGSFGCTVISGDGIVAPLLPMILVFALAALFRNSGGRSHRV